jgi:hypothetical protein
MPLRNLWVTNSIRHLGADELTNLLQQCVGVTLEFIFGSKLLGRCCKMKHYHKPWFDVDCRIAKRELRLGLKANPNSHVAKHQESKLKNLLKKKKIVRKLQELNICVCLPRWMPFRSRKSTSQGHLL